jgi:hypothetical protein
LPVVSTGNTELPKDLTVFPSLNLPVISVANTTSAVPNCQTGGC